MYSKGKVLVVSLIALVVLAIGIAKEGIIPSYSSAETTAQVEIPNERDRKHRGKDILDDTLNELKESGVLTEKDIENIKSYEKSKREARMKEMRNEKINDMVKNNVITSEKGEKLKEALDKKFSE